MAELEARSFPTRDALGAALERELTAACAAAPGRFAALAVGDTTLPHYARLRPDTAAFEGKTLLPVDELWPPPARAERRFAARLRAALPERLAKRVRDLCPEGCPEREAERLEAALAAQGLCAAVLGLGPDGHVAFNQPPSGVDSRTRLVEVAPANLARLGCVAPARHALTLGIATLLGAERLLLVADGPGKERALRRVLEGPEGPDLPASWLRRHSRLEVLIHAPRAR